MVEAYVCTHGNPVRPTMPFSEDQCRLCWNTHQVHSANRINPPTGPRKHIDVLNPLPCDHRGIAVPNAAGTRANAKWYKCDHPEKPLGDVVCSCAGCGPRCAKYTPNWDTVAWPLLLDETRLAPHITGTRFNPSIVRFKGRYLLAFRNRWSGSDIYINELDNDLIPTDRCKKLNLIHSASSRGREDPRLFVHDNKLHVSYTGVEGDGANKHTNQLYAVLNDAWDVEEVYHPAYVYRNVWEKNWVFFSHEGKLYAIYRTHPQHTVLHINGNNAELMAMTELNVLWRYGEIHGGASPVRLGDYYYHFYHSYTRRGEQRTYYTGCAVYDAAPPFTIRRITADPVATADTSTKPHGKKSAVLFVGGAILYNKSWILVSGVHDRYAELREFTQDYVEKLLIDVDARTH